METINTQVIKEKSDVLDKNYVEISKKGDASVREAQHIIGMMNEEAEKAQKKHYFYVKLISVAVLIVICFIYYAVMSNTDRTVYEILAYFAIVIFIVGCMIIKSIGSEFKLKKLSGPGNDLENAMTQIKNRYPD